MNEKLEEVANGPWFTGSSPFRAVVQRSHPKLCVITGPNASGKSLVRKILYGLYDDSGIEFMHTSQAARSRAGIHRAFLYGSEEDDSTGYNSVKTLLKMIQTGQGRDKPFGIMLDEPEVGCSEEIQAAMGDRITGEIGSMQNLHALYIITHSRAMVQSLLKSSSPTHLRLGGDGMSLHDWANRPIGVNLGPDLEDLVKQGRERWAVVQGILNEKVRGE